MILLVVVVPALVGIYKLAVFLLMLSLLIVLHEYGHFIVARRNGVRVNDFAVGFGPTLLKWTSTRSGTNYRINAIPLGGYCAMQGEDGKTSEALQHKTAPALEGDNFQNKSVWQRLAIVLAGPIANFVLAFAILLFSALFIGLPQPDVSTTLGALQPGQPADRAGMQSGDRIVSINGKPVSTGTAMVETIHASPNRPLQITFDHKGIVKTVTVTPTERTSGGKKMGFIGFSTVQLIKRVNPLEAVQASWQTFYAMISGTIAMLIGLFIHPQAAAENLSGPIGIYRIAMQVQDLGWAPYFALAATISISLGIFNLFPIPALDGGRAAFFVAEILRGKPVDPEKEAMVHMVGFAVLMMLMLFVSYHDVANIFNHKGVL